MPALFNNSDLAQAFPEYTINVPALGEGAFKVAYQVTLNDGTEAVLKVLLEPLPVDLDNVDSIDLPERFARELSGMANINSTNIVGLLARPDVRAVGLRQYLWYLEPYYPGGTLETRIAPGGDAALALRVCKALLRAVQDMWIQGKMVHRDIKPGNIVFDQADEPILLDLGIAFHTDLTAITDAMSPSPRTPRYAAPEQFQQRHLALIDFRTDLFLVGMVTFEVLTGQHPFYELGIDSVEYFRRLEEGRYKRDALDASGGSDKFKALVVRLLAPRPSRRFRAIEQAVRAIEGLAS